MRPRLSSSILSFAFANALAFGHTRAAEPALVPVVQSGHKSAVTCSDATPDGKLYVTGSFDNTAILWNATGDKLRTFDVPEQGVASVKLSEDGKLLLIASHYNCELWNLETNTKLPKPKELYRAVGASLSADGKLAAAAFGGTGQETKVAVWDTAAGQQLQLFNTGHTRDVTCTMFSRDGKQLFTGAGDKNVFIWDLATGKRVRELPHNAEVDELSLSQDGRWLVTRTTDQRATLWDTTGVEKARNFGSNNEQIESAVISADGKFLVFGTIEGGSTRTFKHVVNMVNWATGQKLRTLTGHQRHVQSVSLTADAKTLLSGGNDGTLILWDLAKGTPLRTLSVPPQLITALELSGDGKMLAVRFDKSLVALWNLATGERLKNIDFGKRLTGKFRLSNDGKFLLVASDENLITAWNTATGAEMAKFSGHKSPVTDLEFAPDNKSFVSSSLDNTAILWNLAGGKVVGTFAGQAGMRSLSLSADAKTLATVANGGATIWNTVTGDKITTIRESQRPFSCLQLSSDGKTLITGSSDHSVVIWEVATGKKLHSLDCQSQVTQVLLANDEKSLVASTTDGRVSAWNTATGEKIYETSKKYGQASGLAFTKDGKLLIIGARDGSLTFRDATTGKERLVIEIVGNDWLAATPEGQLDGSPNGLKTMVRIRVGATNEFQPLDKARAKFVVPKLLAKLVRGEPLAPDAAKGGAK